MVPEEIVAQIDEELAVQERKRVFSTSEMTLTE